MSREKVSKSRGLQRKVAKKKRFVELNDLLKQNVSKRFNKYEYICKQALN